MGSWTATETIANTWIFENLWNLILKEKFLHWDINLPSTVFKIHLSINLILILIVFIFSVQFFIIFWIYTAFLEGHNFVKIRLFFSFKQQKTLFVHILFFLFLYIFFFSLLLI